jgi:hypothetical protein
MISMVGPLADVLLMRRVMMMRNLAYVLLAAATAACTSPSAGNGVDYSSVRERLTGGPTRLFVGSGSTGTVTARRWTPGGWIEGDTALAIDGGELSASADATGRMKIAAFEVDLAPIVIPEEVFNKPAQLSDVKIKLAAEASSELAWTSNDDATATLQIPLELEWAIAVNGSKTPLGSQHLPPVEVTLALGGDGDVVEASIGVAASGDLWSWAGLLEMTHIELALAAQTVE